MNRDNLLLVVAIIAVVISITGFFVTYYVADSYRNVWFTGFATEYGDIRVEVQEAVRVNFTQQLIDWGTGQVLAGEDNATLSTVADVDNINSEGWSNLSEGFIVKNIGNRNISLALNTTQNAAGFIGGTGPAYEFNVTNNLPDSCTNSTGFNLNEFHDVVANSTGQDICDVFEFTSGRDEIRIDLRLVIPSDSQTGLLEDQMHALFEAV